MPGFDVPGGDYSCTNVNYTDARACERACLADAARCAAYTYVLRPPTAGACCLKSAAHAPPTASAACTSGIVNASGALLQAEVLPLLPGDGGLDLAVFVDRTFVEVFALNGRYAGHAPLPRSPAAQAAGRGAAGMELFSAAGSAGVRVEGVEVFGMTAARVPLGDVLAAARGRRAVHSN